MVLQRSTRLDALQEHENEKIRKAREGDIPMINSMPFDSP